MRGQEGKLWSFGSLRWYAKVIDTALSYINMAVGIVGIVITVLATPAMLGLGASVKLEALPHEMKGLGAGLRLFGVLLVLIVFVFILGLGIVLTLIPLATSLGAAQPVLMSVMTVSAILSTAFTFALLLLDNPLSLPGIVGTIGLAVLAVTAGINSDGGAFALIFALLFVGFAVAGIVGFVSLAKQREGR
jgi:hypothetical protein